MKIRRLGQFDIQTATQISPFGDDANPPNGIRAIYANTGKKGKDVIVGYVNTNLLAGAGEKRIYSVEDDGSISTYIWLKNDGTIQLGGTDDNAVRFSDLKDGFDEVVDKLNDVISAFNQHQHAANATPPTPVPSVIPVVATTATIDSAKIKEITTP